MAKAMKIGSAMTAIGMIGMVTACASPGQMAERPSSVRGKVDTANIGLASKAMAALERGDSAEAIALAERAVEYKPGDAVFRTLLGNAYFAAGRYASAESAYKDSLSISTNQPQVILKMALVSIAQGKKDAAINLLEAARPILDPSDYGLALALAGRPADAAIVLENAASQAGADSRVRQNLALAHALNGDWTMARTVAEQDLAPDQVEARVQQWMTFAQPTRASDQVAALTGIAPAAMDPGQPVRLALNPREDQRYAAAETAPVVETASVESPVPAPVVERAPVETAVPTVAIAAATPTYVAPAPVAVEEAAPAPIVEEASQEVAVPVVAIAAAMPMVAAPVVAAPAVEPQAPALSAKVELPKRKVAPIRRASLPVAAAGGPVVQLGAFANRGNVEFAWSRYAAKYPALRNYRPATARFEKGGSTVYRLSVAGFGTSRDAQSFCSSLKRSGGNCFVRSSASDQPVRIALK